ncbi:MAG: asparagine synthase C-terminal domain-containing protein [Conexivisphaerales archaeon]
MLPKGAGNKFKISKLYGGPTALSHLRVEVTLDELQKAMSLEKGQFAIRAISKDLQICATDPTMAFGFSLLGILLRPQLKGGYIIVCSKNSIAFNLLDKFVPLPSRDLNHLLAELYSFINSIHGKIAVAFSGGLDSSLISWLLRKKDPVLITVGTKTSYDVARARRSASILGLDHQVVTPEQMTDAIRAVSSFSMTIMDYSLAVGFAMVSKRAKELGAKWLVTGQMADELFGGYSRYRSVSKDSITSVLLSDFLNADLHRDALAILSGGVVPIFPYASRPFANLALGLPPDYKIDKIGLRAIASIAGLPEELVKSKKKAFQYGSGIQKIVNDKLNKLLTDA